MHVHDGVRSVVVEEVLAARLRRLEHPPVDSSAFVAKRPCGLDTATGRPT